ncbi:CLUMA_CG008414, isoform A [Clunio marinus]|uniref:CLUMA_CG008414, isoform A n=1 Tax=Clunio marinus TaxID=568069 RepID=A0A1J1I3Z8_9DIPT|nr:CLUMA_CG008414, isoform A [Clunio marinus]
MDKLLLSLSFIVLLASLTVNSAPMSMAGSKLISTIDQRHPKLSDLHSQRQFNEKDQSIQMQKLNQLHKQMNKYDNEEVEANDDSKSEDVDGDDDNQQRRLFINRRYDDLLGEIRMRQNKMIGFRPFSALPFGYSAYSAPVYYPPEFYDDFLSYYGGYDNDGVDDDEEIMSRQNPGNRRRPANGNYKNSPIYYIRLPPTPYMFVPGLGYISQPPTYTPMAPVPQPIAPFYNLPLDFISNGKPTNIYQWGSPSNPFAPPQPQFVPQQPQFSAYPSYQRPQRPYNTQRPVNPFIQESKVTNLKGPFLFNGRPEEIFLLQNTFNPLYSDPRFSSPFY